MENPLSKEVLMGKSWNKMGDIPLPCLITGGYFMVCPYLSLTH